MQQYSQFVDKFKPRHTSDDTHTPPNVYEAVLAWCERRYGIDRANVVRPFFPGGDYANAEYPANCVVIDNPPFSILSQIVRFYLGRKIRFFIFAQSLTMLGHARHAGCAAVYCGQSLTFDNGANVAVGFLTSLEGADVLAVAAPDLGDALDACETRNRKIGKKHVTPLALPNALLTGGRMNYLAAHHTPHTVRRADAAFVRKCDNYPGCIFGGGFLLSERAAAERAAAERAAAERAAAERAAAERAAAERAAAHKVELSTREREIVQHLCETISPTNRKETTMKKLMMIALVACAAVITGCRAVTVENYGEEIARDAESKPVTLADGRIQTVKKGWKVHHNQHWMATEVDTMSATVKPEEIAFSMGKVNTKPSEELTKLVDVSLKGAAELAAKVGAAIATSGGSVAGEAAAGALKNAIAKYISKGGDVANTTVTCEGGNCTFTDGTVSETCTDCIDK